MGYVDINYILIWSIFSTSFVIYISWDYVSSFFLLPHISVRINIFGYWSLFRYHIQVPLQLYRLKYKDNSYHLPQMHFILPTLVTLFCFFCFTCTASMTQTCQCFRLQQVETRVRCLILIPGPLTGIIISLTSTYQAF
jgi:hypothetical protein